MKKPVGVAFDETLDPQEKNAIKGAWRKLLECCPDRGFIFSGDSVWNDFTRRSAEWYLKKAKIIKDDRDDSFIDIGDLWEQISLDNWGNMMPLSLLFTTREMADHTAKRCYRMSSGSLAIQSLAEFKYLPLDDRILAIKGALWYHLGHLMGLANDLKRGHVCCSKGGVHYCTNRGCMMGRFDSVDELVEMAKEAQYTGIFCKECQIEIGRF